MNLISIFFLIASGLGLCIIVLVIESILTIKDFRKVINSKRKSVVEVNLYEPKNSR